MKTITLVLLTCSVGCADMICEVTDETWLDDYHQAEFPADLTFDSGDLIIFDVQYCDEIYNLRPNLEVTYHGYRVFLTDDLGNDIDGRNLADVTREELEPGRFRFTVDTSGMEAGDYILGAQYSARLYGYSLGDYNLDPWVEHRADLQSADVRINQAAIPEPSGLLLLLIGLVALRARR